MQKEEIILLFENWVDQILSTPLTFNSVIQKFSQTIIEEKNEAIRFQATKEIIFMLEMNHIDEALRKCTLRCQQYPKN